LSFQSPSTSVPIPSQPILNSFKIIDSYSNSYRAEDLQQLSPSLAKIDAEFNLKNEEHNSSDDEDDDETDHSFDDNSHDGNDFPFDLSTPPSETLFSHPKNGNGKTSKKNSKKKDGKRENGKTSGLSPPASTNGIHQPTNYNDALNGKENSGLSPRKDKLNDPLPSISVNSVRAQRLKALQLIFMKHYDNATVKPQPTTQPTGLWKWFSKLAP